MTDKGALGSSYLLVYFLHPAEHTIVVTERVDGVDGVVGVVGVIWLIGVKMLAPLGFRGELRGEGELARGLSLGGEGVIVREEKGCFGSWRAAPLVFLLLCFIVLFLNAYVGIGTYYYDPGMDYAYYLY